MSRFFSLILVSCLIALGASAAEQAELQWGGPGHFPGGGHGFPGHPGEPGHPGWGHHPGHPNPFPGHPGEPYPQPNPWERIRCGSNGYQECYADGYIESVRLEANLSRVPCIAGRNFGINGRRLWVSNGCYGQFLLHIQTY